MRMRVRRFLIGAIVVGGLASMVWFSAMSSSEALPAYAETRESSAYVDPQISLSRGDIARQRVLVPAPQYPWLSENEDEALMLEASTEEESETGDLYGFLYGYDSEPLVEHRIVLRDGTGPARGTWTQENGFYEFSDLSPGRYALSYDGPRVNHRSQDTVHGIDTSILTERDLVYHPEVLSTMLGSIEIVSREEQFLILALEGMSRLGGTFRILPLFEEHGRAVKLELRPRLSPQKLVAQATVVNFNKDPLSGYIQFSGIPADEYELWIMVDAKGEDPKVVLEIDLFDDKLELGLVEIHQSELQFN